MNNLFFLSETLFLIDKGVYARDYFTLLKMEHFELILSFC